MKVDTSREKWHKLTKKLEKGDITKEAQSLLKDIRKSVLGNPRVYLDNTLDVILVQ